MSAHRNQVQALIDKAVEDAKAAAREEYKEQLRFIKEKAIGDCGYNELGDLRAVEPERQEAQWNR